MTKDEFLYSRKKLGTLCQAPHSNLYIGHNGNITACCSNRTYVLGKYPDKSLLEIWNGEPAKKLRKELDNFSFKEGCFACSYFLNIEKFKSLKITHYDTEGTYRDLPYPHRLDLELDNKCNLECTMCNGVFSSSIRKNREKLFSYISPYNNDKFLEELTPFLLNAKKINFFGGEPFLITIYDKIFDVLLKNKSKAIIYIQTNGTIFNKKIESICNKLNISISISIDGGTKEIYEKIRKNSSFELISENCTKFNNILNKNKKNLLISSVVSTENIYDLLNLVIFANKHNSKLFFHHVKSPLELSIESLSRLELKKVIDFYEQSITTFTKFLPKNENLNSLIEIMNLLKDSYKIKINLENLKNKFLEELKLKFPDKYIFLLENLNKFNVSPEIFSIVFFKHEHIFNSVQAALENFMNDDIEIFKEKVNTYLVEKFSKIKN